MNTTMASLIDERISTARYDTSRDVTDEQVYELIRLATQAPSAFNMQNWRFIAVRTTEAKAKLKVVIGKIFTTLSGSFYL